MKKTILLLVSLFLTVSAFSQDWETSSVSGDKGVQQTYLTGKWFDNWFIGAGGGVATRFTFGQYSDIARPIIDPSVNAWIMKWFTPSVGVRFGYIGYQGREGLDYYHPYFINHTPFPYRLDSTGEFVDSASEPGVLYYGQMLLHADVLWNLTNCFGGYKKGRFYNISLYISGGAQILYDNKTEGNRGLGSSNRDNEFVLGAGLYNTFRIVDRLAVTLDLRYSNHASRYRTASGVRTNMASATLGLAFGLTKTNWTNSAVIKTTLEDARAATRAAERKTAEVQTAYNDLELDVEDLKAEIENLKAEDAGFVKMDSVIAYEALKARAEKADLVVYFYINQYTLNFSEQYHLEEYVKECLAKNPNHVFHITGSADKGTGTEAINQGLSRNRALYVESVLIKKFGVKKENITVDNVVTDKHLDGAYDRCAILEK